MKVKGETKNNMVDKSIAIRSLLYIVATSILMISSCENKMEEVKESEMEVRIEMPNYHFLVQKEGFRFSFQDSENGIIVPAHAQSGLQIGLSPEKLEDAVSCTYSGHDGQSHSFSVEMADGLMCIVKVRLSEHTVQFSAFPEKGGKYSIVFRAGSVSPGYGLGDDLITAVCPGWRANVIKGKGTEITGFTDPDFRAKGGRERMISNFAIYPVNKFALVNIEPDSKIVRSTSEEIAQGSNDASSLDQLYFFFGDTKQIYSSWLQTRNEVGYPVMKPEYELFGLGWEAWGALAWNTNQKSVMEDVNHYINLGYPLKWMIIGSGFWPREDTLFHTTTSFGMWDPQKYPDPKGLIDYFHQKGLKFMLGLRIAFIVGGPFSEEGVEKGYFLMEDGVPKIFKIGFPKSPIYILDAQNEEAVAWYVDLCDRWGVDGFKEDIYGYGKYSLRDDKLNPVNETLKEKGYLMMLRNNYLGSAGSMHRIEDFNYDQDQDRGAINTMIYPYCGLPFSYTDIIGGLFGGMDFDGEVSPRIKNYMMRNAMWASVHPTMAMGKGPWHFKDAQVDSIILKAAKLHDRLHPYIYSQAMRFYHDGFPWSMAPLPILFPEDPKVHGRENNVDRGYQWMIGDALLATPLYGEDYETANTRNVYLPEGTWMDYETGEKYQGPVMLNDFELPLDKAPLFVGGTGIVVEKAKEGLKARIYPISQSATTVFYDKDGETSSTITIENPDWDQIEVIDKTNAEKMKVKNVRHAYEFDLITGHDYRIQ
jgi:alpha-glucosidase (family GH31 glycosyl hydrolase)